jgi:hypothetical protein
MKYLRRFLFNRMKPQYIFEARNSNIFFILLQNILIGLLLAFPLIFQFVKTDDIMLSKTLFEDLYQSTTWKSEVPDCNFNNTLSCSDTEVKDIQVNKTHVVFDVNDKFHSVEKGKIYMIFKKDYVYVHYLGMDVYTEYPENVGEIHITENPISFIEKVVAAGKLKAVGVIMQLAYPVTIFTNLVFVGFVALLSMLLNIGARQKLSYKKMFALLSYSATIPAIIAFIVGTIVSVAFVYLIYNFGLLFMGYYVFRKYIR